MTALRVLPIALLMILAGSATASAPPAAGHGSDAATSGTSYAAVTADYVAEADPLTGLTAIDWACGGVARPGTTFTCTLYENGVAIDSDASIPGSTSYAFRGTTYSNGAPASISVCVNAGTLGAGACTTRIV